MFPIAPARMAGTGVGASYQRHRPEHTQLYRIVEQHYPAILRQVLGIVHRTLATSLINKAGYTHSRARTGAGTLKQRFGSALNLNIHFHMLFLDGAFAINAQGHTIFVRTQAPTHAELNTLIHKISQRREHVPATGQSG